MRIAYALQMPVLKQGGVEVLVRTLIENVPSNLECYLISPDEPTAIASSSISSLANRHLQLPSDFLNRKWLAEMIRWLRQNRIDLCHFHLGGTYDMGAWTLFMCPMTWTAKYGIPTVVTNHQAVSFFSPDRPPSSFLRRCLKQASVWPAKARQMAAVKWEAAVSQHDLQIAKRYFPFASRKLEQVYHSRLDEDIPFVPVPDSRKILNVSTIAFRKGQHVLVEAFARIADNYKDWSLDLVGYHAEAACLDRIKSIIANNHLEDRVRIQGPCPDPTAFYHDAEIYVQPSLLEGLGLSLQEAMFHGRACIGANTGGIAELINDPSVGILHKSGDPASLADALSHMMNDSTLRKRKGDAARASILFRRMTRQAMSKVYQDLYQKALNPPIPLP